MIDKKEEKRKIRRRRIKRIRKRKIRRTKKIKRRKRRRIEERFQMAMSQMKRVRMIMQMEKTIMMAVMIKAEKKQVEDLREIETLKKMKEEIIIIIIMRMFRWNRSLNSNSKMMKI